MERAAVWLPSKKIACPGSETQLLFIKRQAENFFHSLLFNSLFPILNKLLSYFTYLMHTFLKITCAY